MPRQTIVIDPVTRIEGHSKISIHLDEQGHVEEAYFHVGQFRGFEKFCEGRPFYEMPSLMARICGICPVSHLIASAKACDAILAVRIPENAARLRTILNLAHECLPTTLSARCKTPSAPRASPRKPPRLARPTEHSAAFPPILLPFGPGHR